MRGNRLSPGATSLIHELRADAVDRFDARLICDGLHDDVQEDDQLAALAQAVAEIDHAHDVRERAVDEDETNIPSLCDHAHDVLKRTLDPRLAEVIAERCRVILVDGDDWLEQGWVEADELATAKREAANWLLEHDDVTERLWEESPVTWRWVR